MDPSPEDVGRAFIAALEQGEWHRAAEFLHPEIIRAFRRQATLLLEQWEQGPPVVTVEDLLRHYPDMPREVAEYNVRRANEYDPEPGPALSLLLEDVNTASELAELPDTELCARHIQAADPSCRLRSAYTRAGRPMPAAVLDGQAAGLHRIVLGAVMEGTMTAHLVFRKSWFDRDMPSSRGPLDILTLEWVDGDGWRVREFDFTGHGHGGWVSYDVPDEDGTAEDDRAPLD